MREPLFQELCQVLKDHNNPIMQRLVDNSNQFCFSRSLAELIPSENDPDLLKMFSEGQVQDQPLVTYGCDHPSFMLSMRGIW